MPLLNRLAPSTPASVAAEAGVAHACNAIGEMYLNHPDVPQDYAAALDWFLRGAQGDDADSLYNIGLRYLLGQGVAQDTSPRAVIIPIAEG